MTGKEIARDLRVVNSERSFEEVLFEIANIFRKDTIEKPCEKVAQEEGDGKDKALSVKFKTRETKKMQEPFRSEFIETGSVSRVVKRDNGYELRYLRNGYRRVVFHESLRMAKRLFVQGGETV